MTYIDNAFPILKQSRRENALTDYGKGHRVADWRCGANLALVDAGVSPLRVAHLQGPVLRHRIVDAAEALVGRIREPIDCEKVQISVPDPGHLQTERNRI